MANTFNKVTKRVRLIQTSNNIILNLDANTDIKDNKRLHTVTQYIDGSYGENWVSLGKTIVVLINKLTSVEHAKIRNLWKSKSNFEIITERNENFLVKWIEPTLDFTEDEDFDGSTFYYGQIELTEV